MSDDYLGNTATAGRLTAGSNTITGNLESLGDADWFKITLSAGSQYTFDLYSSGINGLEDPYIKLYNSSGTLLSYDDDTGYDLDALLEYTATTSGTYYLGASSGTYGAGTGAYVLGAEVSGSTSSDDYLGNTATAGRLTAGSNISGNLETVGDADWFKITLSAGSRYTFDLYSSGIYGLEDPYIKLYNSSGTLLSYDDDTGYDLDALLEYTATTSGTYYLGASSGTYGAGAGDYTLFASVVGSASSDDYAAHIFTAGRVSVGSEVSGNLESLGDADWFKITLNEGQRYTFELDGSGWNGLSDPYLSLYSYSGALLASNDDVTDGLNAELSYLAVKAGSYYLAASSSSYSTLSTGNYTLSASTLDISSYAYTSEYLNHLGVTLQEANSFILAHVASPEYIYNTSLAYGITTTMLADIVGNNVTQNDVIGYFNFAGLNPYSLDMIA